MKNEILNFWLICLAYFLIGLSLSVHYYSNSSTKLIQDSIRRLTLIELITEQQFKILSDKVKDLENNQYRISQNDK